jgi:potassium efflux system protein
MTLILRNLVLALVSAAFFVSPALPQSQQSNADIRARLETIGSVFQYVETGVTSNSRRSELTRLRDAIEPLRTELSQTIERLEPRLAEIETQVKALGPAPVKDAPAEVQNIADQRRQLGAQQGEIDGLLKQARVLVLRGDQLAARIEDMRRTRLADRLLERSMSILDPKLWIGAAQAVPGEINAAITYSREWFNTVSGFPGVVQSMLVALVMCAVAVFGIFFAQRWLSRRFTLGNDHAKDVPLPRLRRARAALRDSFLDAAALPLSIYVVIEILSSFDFLVERAHQSALGILAAVTLYSVGRALAGALLRPGDLPRRVLNISDDTASRFYSYATYGLLVAAVGASLNIIHRSLGAPRIMVSATSALMAAAIAIIIIRALMKTRQAVEEGKEDPAPNWLRLLLWIVAVVILGSVLTGYIWLASFMTSRLIHAAIVIASTYVILQLINAYFDEGLKAHTQRGRSFASTLGIRTQSLDLAAALFAGAARVLVFIVAAFLVVGNWGTSLTDLAASFDRASFGIEFGKLRVSLYDVGAAIMVVLVGVYLSRILQRWLSDTVLPRTRLDQSLKNSIATIAGYVGIIATISFGLARLGLNLENIALVAGALSVGIGFGLQAIVSNFVSGLILLTERPIKVGDIVNVKGSEGIVRRISVRSTEVETPDRASVIIPNSELITSAVTNWTHKDLIARISVKIGVAYDSDTEKVREILMAEAVRHKRVLKEPPPVVFFMGFGASTLDLELRCIVDSANFMLSTKSDLHFAILKAFRENKIDIPFPQQDMRIIDPSHVILRGNGTAAQKDTENQSSTPDAPASKR